MTTVEWTEDLSLGVKEIDDQHKKLFGIMNEVMAAIESSSGELEISQVLERLVDYCNYHFAAEEELMRSIEYPGYDEHVLTHNSLRDTITGFAKKHEQDTSVSLDELGTVLSFWFVSHIMEGDKAIATHIRDKAAEE